jgi:hypothetical protein
VSRRVIDHYGIMEWVVTFTSNPGYEPTGSGDVNRLIVVQDSYPAGSLATQPIVTETQKGSEPLGGYFTLDFVDPLQVMISWKFTHLFIIVLLFSFRAHSLSLMHFTHGRIYLHFLQAPRKIRFAETAERMERKLEEMGTVHDVSVIRTEWPSNVTGSFSLFGGGGNIQVHENIFY